MKTSLRRLISTLAIATVTLPAHAAGNENENPASACGITTHGTPLKLKGQQLTLTDPDSFFRVLGPGMLHTQRDGKDITIWYDILHLEQKRTLAAGQMIERRDCGVMFAVIRQGTTSKAMIHGLLGEDIDVILKGVVPSM